MWVELGRQQITLPGGGAADAAVDPHSTRVTAGGGVVVLLLCPSKALELSTLLVPTLAVFLSLWHTVVPLDGYVRTVEVQT